MWLPILALAIMAGALTARAPLGFGQKPVTDDVFKTGKIRFVPLVTITDEAMGGKGVFSRPNDVAVDGQGRVYVNDSKESAIRVFDAAGAYLKTIGRAGQGPGEFNGYLQEIEHSQGRLYALVMRSISVFDSEGVFIKSIKPEGPLWQAFRALPDGRFLIEKAIRDYQSPDHRKRYGSILSRPISRI